MGKYSSFLRESDLFYNLNASQLGLVEKICEEVLVSKGEIIFEENTHQTELFLIVTGEVEIVVNPGMVAPQQAVEKNLQVIATLRRGESFGEIALVDEGIRSAGARAAQKKNLLLRIQRNDLLQLFNAFPDLGYRVMYNLAADLAHKIRGADLRIREALLYKQDHTG